MTGQDIQDKLDAIVLDLQTTGKGKAVQILLRDGNNNSSIFPLSSDQFGVIIQAELTPLQAFVDAMKPIATAYETGRAPVEAALDVFKAAQVPHQALYDAASAARVALGTALENDTDFQAAKTALETARNDVAYVNAVAGYKANNISENFGNLSDAKGKYVSAGGGGEQTT